MPSADISEVLAAAADDSRHCQRVLQHHEGQNACPEPMDFYEALRHDSAVVVRLHGKMPGERHLPIDCRFHRSVIEFTHEHRDIGITGRDQFFDDVRRATEVEVLHHRESQFDDDLEPADQPVATDGGVAMDEQEVPREDLTSQPSGTPTGGWPIRGLVAIEGARTEWTHQCQSNWLTQHPERDDDLKTELARRIRDNYGDGEFAFRVSQRGGFQVLGDGSPIVLVASTRRTRCQVYHTPDRDDPTQPACHVDHGNRWYPKPVSVLENRDRCNNCPEEDT